MNRTRDEKILKKFGKHLEKIRNEKKLSLRKLADNADVDFSQIHRIEKGVTNPSLTMLLALSEGLGVPVEELIQF
ncbi:MAG: helix-turn-helix domain-containing protein [Chitinophagaceae bacterium]|nr:helix-turn-helix domain-containing protein [Chitinophagaceae bacterium]MDP1809757.1 helix-turn-helix transcriptional regulator [Sediminibacterium sp.]MDP3129385.1 helix-turn-helix transcriptional regulator [Sediminibacterium sp.]MDP3666845.1 helix-turn-helix transcriptional regulator [Sediminibacterium sp.]